MYSKVECQAKFKKAKTTEINMAFKREFLSCKLFEKNEAARCSKFNC